MTSKEHGQELVEAIHGAVDDWVVDDDINFSRRENQIVADEEELVENICIMIAIVVGEASAAPSLSR